MGLAYSLEVFPGPDTRRIFVGSGDPFLYRLEPWAGAHAIPKARSPGRAPAILAHATANGVLTLARY